MASGTDTEQLPFGALQGYAPGPVPAYSSDYKTVNAEELPDRHAFRHYVNGIYTGYKWQCVEFARRWLLVNKGYVFDDIAMAYDIFRLTHVTRIADGERLPLKSFENGSIRHPEPGAMLIWSEGGEFERTGHVAIVTEVFPDRIRVAEQNVDFRRWLPGEDYARELTATVDTDGSYWIKCSYKSASILGWVIQTNDSHGAVEFPPADPMLYQLQLRELPPHHGTGASWLNLANPDEASYVALMGGHKLVSNDADRYKYFCISATAHNELKRATNELHALFMHATDYVLQDFRHLEKFCIPEALWPRIRQSWNNRRNQMITGRFDFCLTEQGIKLYEYNADSSSCYMECGKVQGKWAEHFECDDGMDPGEPLFEQLIAAWKQSEVQGVVHIMRDSDPEETYHALFMKEAMEAAGLQCKIVVGVTGLQWGEGDSVLDEDGVEICWVWKTWAWETALDQLRAELDETVMEAEALRTAPPRLMDVLLRPGVMVFEPLWTLIPSNKAILPVLQQLFPEHPQLLNTAYELNAVMQQGGYVSKPIAGRCGANVRLIGKRDAVLDETGGNFDHQEVIYQELCRLPEVAGFHAQISCFSVAGYYAGSCLRGDKTPIITRNTDVLPLRVLQDQQILLSFMQHQT